MDTYDVIIVGGSVSGAPTAMLLARRGYRVLLVDRQEFPRDVNSTHFIWPRGVSYLNRWGLGSKFADKVPHCREMEINVEGISLVGSVPLADLEQRFASLHGDSAAVTDLYMGPRRFFLDDILLEAAREAGADVRTGFEFRHLLTEEGRVTGIAGGKPDGSSYQAQARLVIGADGRYSDVAEQVAAKTVDYRPLSTFAYYGYFSGIEQSMLAIHKKGRLGTAIFPTLDDTHMVLVYGPSDWWDEFRKDAEQNFLYTYAFCAPDIAQRIAAARREEPFKSCGWMPAFKRTNTGPGWALIGDAGSFKDQVSAMGITHAFRDASLIVEHLDQAFSMDVSLKDALDAYARVRASDYDRYFDLVCKVAEMNPYEAEEVEQIYAMRNDQAAIDAMISQFGDTLPVTASAPAGSRIDGDRLPDFLRDYDVDRLRYRENIYLGREAGSPALASL